MTILLVGGGSGGHIMPLLAVARELRERHPDIHLIYIGEKGGKFSDIPRGSGLFDECHFVCAGKLRRYHGESWLRRLTDIKTITLNARDIFRLIIGTIQSLFLIRRLNADAALLKGGYVCVPVGYGCKAAKTPFITHDSDAVPGLSNRIIGRYASLHAVALEAGHYPYPKEKTVVVGVPANPEYSHHKNPTDHLKKKYGVASTKPILLVTGGSQGAHRLNEMFIQVVPLLVDKYPKIHIFHHIGELNQDYYRSLPSNIADHVTRFDFSNELYEMSALADIVITRGGATTLAEFGAQGKACIIVPHPELAGDHQTKNAQLLQGANAAVVVARSDADAGSTLLFETIVDLVDHPKKRALLGKNLQALQPKKTASSALVDALELLVDRGSRNV